MDQNMEIIPITACRYTVYLHDLVSQWLCLHAKIFANPIEHIPITDTVDEASDKKLLNSSSVNHIWIY